MPSDEASVRSWYDQVQKLLSSSSVSCNVTVGPTLFSLPTILFYFVIYLGDFGLITTGCWPLSYLPPVLTFRDIILLRIINHLQARLAFLLACWLKVVATTFFDFTIPFLILSNSHDSVADAYRCDPPGYIGEFEEVDDRRSGKIVIQLNGRLNKTGVISPRYDVKVNQIERWVNLLLPSRGFGYIILVRP